MAKSVCMHNTSKVINLRDYGGNRYRRRECLRCLHRWSTIEYEVNLHQGKHKWHLEALREKLGLTRRQQNAIAEVIQSFLDFEDSDDD